MPFSFLQFDENVKLIIRRYDQANCEPEKSLLSEGRSLKPETPEPDGDSNQERAKDRGKDLDHLNWQMLLLDYYPEIKAQMSVLLWSWSGQQGETANSFLATLASSSSEEMEAELQERVESSKKQASHAVEIYECLKSTVDQLKVEFVTGTGELKKTEQLKIVNALKPKYNSVCEMWFYDLFSLLEGSLWQAAAKLNSLLGSESERLKQFTDDLKQKHSHMTSEVKIICFAFRSTAVACCL